MVTSLEAIWDLMPKHQTFWFCVENFPRSGQLKFRDLRNLTSFSKSMSRSRTRFWNNVCSSPIENYPTTTISIRALVPISLHTLPTHSRAHPITARASAIYSWHCKKGKSRPVICEGRRGVAGSYAQHFSVSQYRGGGGAYLLSVAVLNFAFLKGRRAAPNYGLVGRLVTRDALRPSAPASLAIGDRAVCKCWMPLLENDGNRTICAWCD